MRQIVGNLSGAGRRQYSISMRNCLLQAYFYCQLRLLLRGLLQATARVIGILLQHLRPFLSFVLLITEISSLANNRLLIKKSAINNQATLCM
jgi:hypothetical protein